MIRLRIQRTLRRGLCSPFLPVISFLTIILGVSLCFLLVPDGKTSAWQPGCKMGADASLGMTATDSLDFNFTSRDLTTWKMKKANLRVGYNTNNCYGFTARMSTDDRKTSLDHEDPTKDQEIGSIATESLETSFAGKAWGYRLEDGSPGVPTYKPIPSVFSPDDVYSQADPGNSAFELVFAVKVAPGVLPGTYGRGLVVSLTTNSALNLATFLPGPEFANVAKSVVNGAAVKRFERSEVAPAIYGQANPTPSEIAKYPKVSTDASGTPIYLWREGDRLLWWADTDLVYANENCEGMFKGLTGYSHDDNAGLFVDMKWISTSRAKNMKAMFAHVGDANSGYSRVNGLNLPGFDTRWVNNMESMFEGVNASAGVDLSNFDTRQVTNMKNMFKSSHIQGLNIGSLNTNRVTDMSGMFALADVGNLNLGSFQTINVTDMSNMFNGATVQSLDLSTLYTGNVTNMAGMFGGINMLGGPDLNLQLGSFSTLMVTDMSGMFASPKIVGLDISAFDTWKVTNMKDMFLGAAVTTLNLSNFDTSEVKNMSGMFAGTENLRNLNITSFDTTMVEDMSSMFSGTGALNLNIANFDTIAVTNMKRMFADLKNVTSLDLSSFYTRSVQSMREMFKDSEKLTNVNLTSFDTTRTTDMRSMFANCKAMTSYDLGSFNTGEVIDMSEMFSGNLSLNALDLANFNTSRVGEMSSMFANTPNLTSLNISSFDTGTVTHMDDMFKNTGLTALDLSHFNTENVMYMDGMFAQSANLASINLANFDTNRVITMASMFEKTTSLVNLDLSSFDTWRVSIMSLMFADSGVRKVEVGADQFDTESVYSGAHGGGADDMFKNAVNLVGGNGTVYDPNHISQQYAHVDVAGNPGYFTLKP